MQCNYLAVLKNYLELSKQQNLAITYDKTDLLLDLINKKEEVLAKLKTDFSDDLLDNKSVTLLIDKIKLIELENEKLIKNSMVEIRKSMGNRKKIQKALTEYSKVL